MKEQIDIKDIIKNKNLEIKFEPVASVIKQSIIGFQASSNGCTIGGKQISMCKLLELAKSEDMTIELDRLYREKAVESFSKIYYENREMLLFLNISASIITRFIGSGIIMELINAFKLNPQNVVLEIVEDKIEDVESIKKFINFYRSHGFIVSLSDIGYGLANLDKISYVEPDIIKISGAITNNIDLDYYKQEVFKALVNLSKNIGALVIGDGIETKEEALTVMELGADMIEGRFFGLSTINEEFVYRVREKLKSLSIEYKTYMIYKTNLEKSRYRLYENIINEVLRELSNSSENEFDSKLKRVIDRCDVFECIYVLDENGIQVTDTFTYCKNMISQKALIFYPAKQGTDHSLKKYYYFLRNMALNKYVTEPYVSLATGNLCITISSVFKNIDGREYILCIDFNPKYIDL
ncbi:MULTISPECIES: EAL domain-containing protein [Clostridium]|jgi:EAL domain-containing protein (putative c-di-GMP-specific phosphodiesterase class I)|uniref:Putative EAL-domain containing protein YkuI n=2 Tax=Clostridium TaxID=1485 RepID=A0A151AQV3_9CLOT|nr:MULTISPECIES: EAL domain-containing protein [Clostridium]KYH29985.1 putative EAL-domain containing protein YkuI [Clostridium colicanis DSM 13634]MBE6044192.1 EAL domain-containing protein [Clostridium thermopalmarium]PRR75918.1 putative EAL-domain containing protein YkuI [Clostridium thermopalmarium DSM 5974]PVZ24495.1 EAL domain-containing protein (putative c-di-GMP-specific phosphodiesterase class I) [Clostridium thermopalmarium DSM 5974]